MWPILPYVMVGCIVKNLNGEVISREMDGLIMTCEFLKAETHLGAFTTSPYPTGNREVKLLDHIDNPTWNFWIWILLNSPGILLISHGCISGASTNVVLVWGEQRDRWKYTGKSRFRTMWLRVLKAIYSFIRQDLVRAYYVSSWFQICVRAASITNGNISYVSDMITFVL